MLFRATVPDSAPSVTRIIGKLWWRRCLLLASQRKKCRSVKTITALSDGYLNSGSNITVLFFTHVLWFTTFTTLKWNTLNGKVTGMDQRWAMFLQFAPWLHHVHSLSFYVFHRISYHQKHMQENSTWIQTYICIICINTFSLKKHIFVSLRLFVMLFLYHHSFTGFFRQFWILHF